jgi:hemerythrin-like domain-containing protein
MNRSRRTVLLAAAGSTVGLVGGGVATYLVARPQQEEGVGVSAPEDLMREHGLLNRILLIYEEGLRRLNTSGEMNAGTFHQPAQIVRQFVEDYHERLEERFVFPEFEHQQKLVELVRTLRRQHQAGRKLTDVIIRHSSSADRFQQSTARQEIRASVEAFIRMYRPHEAREDTVLFPTFRKIVSAQKIKELGDRFEDEENRRFGNEGFEHMVERVAGIERQLGIYNLEQFTPSV